MTQETPPMCWCGKKAKWRGDRPGDDPANDRLWYDECPEHKAESDDAWLRKLRDKR